MSWNETIDNYLYDEENEYTQADDLWDDFFVERRDEIDERPWNQADALAHRNTSASVVVGILWMNSLHSLTGSAK